MKHCGKCFEEFLLSSLTRFRSTHPEVFYQKDLRNFAKFTGRHLCQGLFFNKVAGLSLQLYLKKDPGASVFSCEFLEILKNTFLTEQFRMAASTICSIQLQYSIQYSSTICSIQLQIQLNSCSSKFEAKPSDSIYVLCPRLL